MHTMRCDFQTYMVDSTPVASMLSSAVTRLNSTAAYTDYANSLTELDVWCVVVANTNAMFYDYYDLAVFNATSPCSRVAWSTVQLEKEKAANLSGEYNYMYSCRNVCFCFLVAWPGP